MTENPPSNMPNQPPKEYTCDNKSFHDKNSGVCERCVRKTPKEKEWEREFDEILESHETSFTDDSANLIKSGQVLEVRFIKRQSLERKLKSFISQLLAQAKEEGREELLNELNITKDFKAAEWKRIVKRAKEEERAEILGVFERIFRLYLQGKWNDQSEVQVLSPDGKEIIWGGLIGDEITKEWEKVKKELEMKIHSRQKEL